MVGVCYTVFNRLNSAKPNEAVFMKKIKLTQGKVALVDDEDFEELNQHKWYAYSKEHLWYARRSTYIGKVDGRYKQDKVLMHRQIMGTPKDMETDHKNGNGLDNRKSNLRVCTHAQNSMNQRRAKNNTSGYRGVWLDRKLWRAVIRVGGQRKDLGRFKSKTEAVYAYKTTMVILCGEYYGIR